jgi:hypothetical protein
MCECLYECGKKTMYYHKMLTPMLSNKEPHCSLGHYRVIISLLVYEVVSAPT